MQFAPLARRRPAPAPDRHRLRVVLAASTLALLGACGSSDDDAGGTVGSAPEGAAGGFAFMSGVTPTFDAGQIERFALGDEIAADGVVAGSASDIEVATDGTDVYRIGKFMIDTLTRYRADDLDTVIWEYSVTGEEDGVSSANPYEIVFASETKAYVIRYGSPLVWIVDPTATDQETFKTGEIDLAAYDVDDAPQASDAVLVDGKLFVLMQRLETREDNPLVVVKDSYVAVIDTASDTEIATGMGEDSLDGIRLDVRNGVDLSYEEESGLIYVVATGNFFENPLAPGENHSGGIATIDPESYATELLLDDGTDEDSLGYVTDALVVSASKGYVVTFTGYNADFTVRSTALRTFNPITGTIVGGEVPGTEGLDIALLAEGPDGRIWIGMNDPNMPGFRLLDPSDDSIVVERVPSLFNPTALVFVEGGEAP